MPNKIYPVDIGGGLDIKTPSTGRPLSSSGGPKLNMNPLLSLQADLIKKENDLRIKRIMAADATVLDVLKGNYNTNNPFGIKTPLNPYQSSVLNNYASQIEEVSKSFATKQNPNTVDVSDYISNVRKVTANDEFRNIINESNKIASIVAQTKDKRMHKTYLAKLDNVINNTDGNYKQDLADLDQWQRYEVVPIKPEKDFDDVSKMTVSLIERDMSLGKLVNTETIAKDAAKEYLKNKYQNNLRADFEAGVNFTGDGQAFDNTAMTYEEYAEMRANELADPLTKQVKKTLSSDPIEDHNRKLVELQKGHEYRIDEIEKKSEKDLLRLEKNYEGQKAIQKLKTERTVAMTDAQKEMTKKAITDIKTKNNKATDEQITEASSKIVPAKGESKDDVVNRINSELNSVEIPVSSEHLSNVKSDIEKELNSGNSVIYRVYGNKDDHDLRVESESKVYNKFGTPRGTVKGKTKPYSLLESVSSIKIKDGKRIAVANIITKWEDRYNSVPSGMEGYKHKLTEDEKKELKKSGLDIDVSKEYYRIPAEIELKGQVPDSFSTKTRSSISSIAGRNNNPTNMRIKGSSTFQSFDSLEDGFEAAVADITEKIKDTPAIRAKKKQLGTEDKPTSIKDLIETWSPRESFGGDNSDKVVDSYIDAVSNTLGLNPETPISEIHPRDLALALAKHEDPNVYKELLGIIERNLGNKKEEAIATPDDQTLPSKKDAPLKTEGAGVKKGETKTDKNNKKETKSDKKTAAQL